MYNDIILDYERHIVIDGRKHIIDMFGGHEINLHHNTLPHKYITIYNLIKSNGLVKCDICVFDGNTHNQIAHIDVTVSEFAHILAMEQYSGYTINTDIPIA